MFTVTECDKLFLFTVASVGEFLLFFIIFVQHRVEWIKWRPNLHVHSNMAGTGQARVSGGDAVAQNDKGQQQAYLHLALSIISAFCRLPELAAMDENISKVSILVETLASKYNLSPSFSYLDLLLCFSRTKELLKSECL
jgi:hypothetical protein